MSNSHQCPQAPHTPAPKEISTATKTWTHSNHAPSISRTEATADLVSHNDPLKRHVCHAEMAAEARLQEACHWAHSHPWLPDLMIKMFADIDLVFYGGYLLGNVGIKWVDDEKARRKVGYEAGCREYSRCTRGRRGQAKIRLNSNRLLMGTADGTDLSFNKMWETTLHEMVVSGPCPANG